MLNQNLLLTGDNGYNLTKSLRFRSSASAYLNRTLTTPTNQKIWTWSSWIKRGTLDSSDTIFSTSDNYNTLRFTSTGSFIIYGDAGGTMNIETTQVFRDPSAWYHFVIAFDSTQATASNRVKFYVNGTQVTAFATATYPSLNATYGFNSAIAHAIGRRQSTSNLYLDGYLAEVNFIDGQALTPTSFGSTNALTGVWQPAKYTGTYGTNGFYLPFTNTTSTTTLGYDFSGNSNNWTTNNLSLTTGSTYDSMTDVPTLTSATTANYATLNPLMYRVSNTPAATLSNGNLTSTHTPSAYGTYVFSTIAGIGNKFYYEVTITSLVGGGDVGIDDGQGQYSLSTGRAVYLNDGRKIINGSISAYGASFTTGDVIGVAFDLINGTITFYKNGTSQGVASSSIGTSAYFSFGEGDTGTVYNWNYGQRPFAYTPPTGFVALNTYNLPTSTIVKGNTVMDATTYTGTTSAAPDTQTISSLAFKPDLVWIKCRSTASNHRWNDSVRGANNWIASNSTNAETSDPSANASVSSFNSNGWSMGYNGETSLSGRTYVGWTWQAGQGTTSSNTSGSITSTVSVNASAGFSVVTYTGNGTSGATVGHGLGVAPAMMIIKTRSAVNSWVVYHQSLGNTKAIYLNLTGGADTNSSFWNNTSPTSSVLTLGTDTICNQNGTTYVAYCWAEVAGFSKFGSYTGNGSADGPFVYLGFRPKFVIIKNASVGSTNWFMYDSARNTYNVVENLLLPNASAAEYSGYSQFYLDFLSNGFKIKATDSQFNGSGNTLIYMAFAENPFKNALAR